MVTRMKRKVNLYFFGEEEIPLKDSIIFYGQYIIMILGAIITFVTKFF